MIAERHDVSESLGMERASLEFLTLIFAIGGALHFSVKIKSIYRLGVLGIFAFCTQLNGAGPRHFYDYYRP